MQGKVPFVSKDGIHQLHIFIFVLALFHVLYCVLTLALGRAKVLYIRSSSSHISCSTVHIPSLPPAKAIKVMSNKIWAIYSLADEKLEALGNGDKNS